MIIFSICFLHFYSNYSEDYTFELYLTQDLIKIFTKHNVLISNLHQFKVFCFAFFHQSMKEMNNFNYKDLKKMYQFYNMTIIDEQNIIMQEVNKYEPLEKSKNFINKFAYNNKNKINISCIKNNITSLVTKKVMTPLISATERVVDIILSVFYINIDG